MSKAIPMPLEGLSDKQVLFYHHYLKTLNATKSAILAGYAESTADKKAYRWVGKSREKCPKSHHILWDAIQLGKAAQVETIGLTEKWLISKYMEVAGFSLQDITDPETGQFLPLHELPPEAAAGIEGVKLLKESKKTEDGAEVTVNVLEFKTVSATARLKALDFLTKYKRIDPTLDYKTGGAQGGSEKSIIKNVLAQVDGATRGLPAPVHEIPEHFNLVEDQE